MGWSVSRMKPTVFILYCRRVQQLQYFGEVFDPAQCGTMRGTECDNCKAREQSRVELTDITDRARELVRGVQRLAGSSNWQRRNFTMNHLVDIMRGSKKAQVELITLSVDCASCDDSCRW